MSAETRKPWDREDDRSFLEIYDLDTRSSRLVKRFDYLIEAPNWSPDGRELIYNSRGRIWRLDIETGEARQVDSGYATACNNDHVLSPDGREIAVSHHTAEDGQSRIYRLPLDGGQPELITALAPSYLHGWSPDGELLAYCAERGGEYDVYVIPAAGGVERRLTDAPGLNDGPEFSPCGQYIWFNSVRTGRMQAWRMRVDGSEQTQMTHDTDWNTWFPHISPDGEHVVMLCYDADDLEPHEHLPHLNVRLRLMRADGSGLEELVELFGGQGTINVNSWSPCSRYFAYVHYALADRQH